jgi:hypothetical protein
MLGGMLRIPVVGDVSVTDCVLWVMGFPREILLHGVEEFPLG